MLDKPTILHIDINSYFATMMQQEVPSLRGKPVGIVKDIGRSCVIAASKEAKKLGVKTGCRAKDAKKLAPNIIFIPAQFDFCLSATKKLKAIFENISPDVHIYSLDEAFVDVTHCQQYLYHQSPLQLAKVIQKQIKDQLGEWVTCNIGISHNRLLAKMGSEISPPDTVFEINDDNKDAILSTVEFKDVCGVGYRLQEKLKVLGITHPYQLRFYSLPDLEPYFGPFWVEELHRIAYGEEPHVLRLLDRTLDHMKSVGRSITGYRVHDNEDEIKRILFNLMEEVTYKVRRMGLAGRYVWIKLYGSEGRQRWRAHRTLPYYIRHTTEMFQIAYHELYGAWQRDFKVIKFAVRLGMLEPLNETPQTWFPDWHRQEKMYQAMDKISDKYGLFTLRSGRLLNRDIIRPEVTGFFGDKTYQLGQ